MHQTGARLCTVAAAAHEHHVRIVVVGDVHNQYSHTLDTAALHALNPDVTVFVGDLANEDVEIVRTVAQCPLRKVVVLGNHDAWYDVFLYANCSTHSINHTYCDFPTQTQHAHSGFP